MNKFLWILQILICMKCISIAYTHGIRKDQLELAQGIERLENNEKVRLNVISIFMFFSGIGLLLPAVFKSLGWIAPWAGVIISAMMILSIVFHINCRDVPKIWASLIFFALVAFVVYGRWKLAPLS